MTDLEFLKGVREKITAPGDWTQHDYAVNKHGGVVLPEASSACAWCIVGAGLAVAFGGAEARLYRLLAVDVIQFNDSHTHAEVLALLDRNIAELKGTSNENNPA